MLQARLMDFCDLLLLNNTLIVLLGETQEGYFFPPFLSTAGLTCAEEPFS